MIILILVLLLVFPEEIFSGLAGILLLLMLALLVLEVILDLYLVVAFFWHERRNRK
jgi:hypothetical protein